MAINRFYRRTPYEGQLYAPPLDVIERGLQVAQKRFDTNYAYAEAVKNNYIESLQADRARANELQDAYNQSVESIVKKYNGDWSQATNELRELNSRIRKDFGPGGEARAIISNYSTYADWLKRNQERVASGKLLAEDLNVANDYYLSGYKGIGQIDPVTQTYNRFTPDELVDYMDPNSIIQDTFKEFKPQSFERAETVFHDGIQEDITVKYDGIDPNRLYPSFKTALAANPKLSAYLAQKAKYHNLTSDDVERYLDVYSKSRASDLGYMNESRLSKSQRDPLYLAQEKGRQDRLTASHKQKLKEEAAKKIFQGSYDWLDATETITNKPLDIDENNWRESVRPLPEFFNTPERKETLKFGRQAALTGTVPGHANIPPNINAKLEDFITSKEAQMKGVDPHLATKMFEDAKNSAGNDFNRYYGKNKTWTDNFEKKYWQDYKQAHKDVGLQQSKAINIPQVAVSNLLKDIVPSIASGTASAYRPGDSATQTISQLGIDVKKLVSDNGTIKQNVGVKYIIPGTPGYPMGGFLISSEEGKFVLVDQETSRQELNSRFTRALSPINNENKLYGNELPIETAAGTIGAKPKLTYIWDGSKYKREVNFVVKDPNSNDEVVLSKSQGNPLTLTDIMDSYLPQYQSMLNYGASKADLTSNEFYNIFQNDDE